MNRAPELAREGGRRGPEVAGTLVEGVGGRMEDEEVATAEADEGGLTGVLLLRRQERRRHEEHSKVTPAEWRLSTYIYLSDLLLMLYME